MAVVISDTFTRANSSSAGTTEVGGKAWASYGATGVAGITNNTLYGINRAADPDTYWIGFDSGYSDNIKIEVKYANSPYTSDWTGSIIFRATDISNFIHLQAGPNGYYIESWIGGNYQGIIGQYTGGRASGDVVAVILEGTSIKVNRNGEQIISITYSPLQTGSVVGLNFHQFLGTDANAVIFDDFKMETLSSSTVHSVSGSADGVSSVTGIALKSTVLIRDTFDRANSTTSLGTSTSGQAWTAVFGTWGISSNEAYSVSDGDGNMASISIPTNPLDYTVSYSMKGAISTGNTRRLVLMFRHINTQNFWLLSCVAGGMNLVRVDNDTFVSQATATMTTADDTYYRISARCVGNNIKIYADGVLKIDYTMSTADAAKFSTVPTKVGLRLNKTGTPTFATRANDFVVETIGSSTEVQSVSGSSDGTSSVQADASIIPSNTTVFLDTFTGTDGTLLTAHNADTKPASTSWTQSAGGPTFGIQNNKLAAISGTEFAIATHDSGLSNFVLESDITYKTGNDSGIVFRSDGTTANRWSFYIQQSPLGLRLVKDVGGSSTDFFPSAFTPVNNTTYRLKVVADGGNIEVFVDGVSYKSITDTSLMTNTKHGIVTWKPSATSDVTWDNLSVKSLSSGQLLTASGTSDGISNVSASPITIGGNSALSDGVASVNANVVKTNKVVGSISGAGSVVASPRQVVQGIAVDDSFTGTEGSNLTAHTPDSSPVGATWQPAGDLTFAIRGNKAVAETTFGSGIGQANIESGLSDFILEADVIFKSGQATGVNFRSNGTSATRWTFVAVEDGSSTKIEANLSTFEFTPFTFVDGNSYRFKVVADGDSVKCYVNDIEQHSITSSTNINETKHGLSAWVPTNMTPTIQWDNFSVRSISSPVNVIQESGTTGGVSTVSSVVKVIKSVGSTSSNGASDLSSTAKIIFSATVASDGSANASSNTRKIQFSSAVVGGTSSGSAQVYKEFVVQTSSNGIATVVGTPISTSSIESFGISSVSGTAIITTYASGDSGGIGSVVASVTKKHISVGQSDAFSVLDGTPIVIRTGSAVSNGISSSSATPIAIGGESVSSNGQSTVQASIKIASNLSAAADGETTVLGNINLIISSIFAQASGTSLVQGNIATGQAVVDVIKLNGQIIAHVTLEGRIEPDSKLVATIETEKQLKGIIG